MISLLILTAGLAASALLFCIVWPFVNATPVEQTQFRPTFWRLFSLPIAVIEISIAPLAPNFLLSWMKKILSRSGLRLDLSPHGLVAGCVVSAALLGLISIGCFSAGYCRAWHCIVAISIGFFMPLWSIKSRAAIRETAILRQLPFTLDLITLAVESGLNLSGAIQETVEKGPLGPLRDELSLVMRDMRTGTPRSTALQAMADRLRIPAISHFVGGLAAAEKQGAALGSLLRAQAAQRRIERFTLAEKRAMQAPVKMLFPLIAFIFPCTFIVLFFPILFQLAQEGWIK